jgi:hypothetical protein
MVRFTAYVSSARHRVTRASLPLLLLTLLALPAGFLLCAMFPDAVSTRALAQPPGEPEVDRESSPVEDTETQKSPATQKRLDPAAWGDDHVGEELPEFIESGECLFCHRYGLDWQKDPHALTIHDADDTYPSIQALAASEKTVELSSEVTLVLGGEVANRFLKRGADYGKLDLLTTGAEQGRTKRWRLTPDKEPHWDTKTFALRCAGCHTTGVDAETQAFSLLSLDCFVCHGDAPLDHANDPQLVTLAAERKDRPEVIVSICAQCHVRIGKSKSSGLPYPNNFVAGDNLFRDFEFDFSKADDEKLNPTDRHVLDNVRDVVLHGKKEVTCLTCHSVHESSTARHRDLAEQQSCAICHPPDQPKKVHRVYRVHSTLCGY